MQFGDEDEPLSLEQERAILYGMLGSLGTPREHIDAIWRAKHPED